MPIIFITAFPEESVRARALDAGAVCFLTKPFDGPTLIKYLDTALQRHGDGTGAYLSASGARGNSLDSASITLPLACADCINLSGDTRSTF